MKAILKFLPYISTIVLLSFVYLLPTQAERTAGAAGVATSASAQQERSEQTPGVVGELIQAPGKDLELAQRLRSYDLLRLDSVAAAAQIRRTGKLLLHTTHGTFDLKLSPNDLRAHDYSAQVIGADGIAQQLPRAPLQTYKGTIAGHAGQARFTITENNVEGLLITEGERFYFEPARSVSGKARADEFVFYRSGDVIPAAGECGVTLADEVAAEAERNRDRANATDTSTTTALDQISPVTPMRIVRLATDADAEYVGAFGDAAGANTRIMNIMNQVDGVYQVEIGATFQITFQNTWTDAATDPYSATAASDLLSQFRNHWNANFNLPQHSRSLAHFWTGKDLDGGTIGVAYVAVLCQSSSFSYGLSQRFPTSGTLTAQSVALTAHEMGHNFSGRHPNVPTTDIPRDIEAACVGSVMNSSIGTSTSFCPYSRSQMVGFANANPSCLLDSGSSPPAPSLCSETPLSLSVQIVNGSLATSDCRSQSRGVTFYADMYSFQGIAGQQVIITMNRTGTVLDPYLYLIGPTGYVIMQDNNGNGGVNAIIGSPFTLPQSGKYFIEATSSTENQTEGYSLSLTNSGCVQSVTPGAIQVPAAGANGNISVGGNCAGAYPFRTYTNPNNGTWLANSVPSGTGNQDLGYTVQPNTNAAGRLGFLIVGGSGSAGTFGGLRIPVHQSGTGPDCVPAPITFGQTINSSLNTSDCQSPIRGNLFYSKRFSFTAAAGQRVAITSTSGGLDSFLTLIGPDGAVILNDDDSAGGFNARIPGGQGFLTLGLAGTYTIEINGFSAGSIGPFALTLNTAAAGTQLTATTYNVLENDGSLNVTVSRGDAAGAASVDFATPGPSGNCTHLFTGTALQNCDYTISAGTVHFAAGETSKSFTLLINDDLFVEGSESFTVSLSNPVGTTLGAQSSATITINDNDTAPPTTNLIDVPGYFVRQQYYDLLARLPDPGGLAFWTAEVQMCGGDPTCRVRRVEVSNAFFYEDEYQRTGSYVFRLYRAAYGNDQPFPNPDNLNPPEARKIPSYAVFVPDRTRVVESPDVAQSQLNLANLFVARPEFIARYPLSLTGPQFVSAILQTIRSAGTELGPHEDALLNAFNQGGRGAVLYRLADDNPAANPVNNQLFVTNEYNRAFVFTEYAGYLRRDSDIAGFLFWLGKVNAFPVRDPFIQQTMVCAFITSVEYQHRFSPVVTRTNADCGN